MTALKLRRGQADIQAAMTGTVVDPSTYPIASPWSTSDLQRIVAEDVFGSDLPINTRGAAMRIPAIRRGRNLIVSSIDRLPLVAMRAGEPLPAVDDAAGWAALYARTPAWMYRCSDGSSPQLRMAWTVDDLMFYGASLWWRRNGTDGFPIDAGRVNQGDWHIDSDYRVCIGGIPQADDQVILIPHFDAGILTDGVDVLKDIREMYRLMRERLQNPIAATELHQVSGRELTLDERNKLIDSWIVARKRGDNIGFTNKDIEVKTHGEDIDQQLMIEGRNAAVVDIARLIGISAGLLDATTPKASLNYETKQGRNEEFVDRDVLQYMTPILARLSMDDVLPRGTRSAFDMRDLTGPALSPTGPDLQD